MSDIGLHTGLRNHDTATAISDLLLTHMQSCQATMPPALSTAIQPCFPAIPAKADNMLFSNPKVAALNKVLTWTHGSAFSRG